MNVMNLPLDHFWWAPLAIAAVVVVVAGVILKLRDLF